MKYIGSKVNNFTCIGAKGGRSCINCSRNRVSANEPCAWCSEWLFDGELYSNAYIKKNMSIINDIFSVSGNLYIREKVSYTGRDSDNKWCSTCNLEEGGDVCKEINKLFDCINKPCICEPINMRDESCEYK